MTPLGLTHASTIVDAALAHGRQAELAPLTVVVLDPGGHVVALKREDGAGILRPQIAHGKAWGALGMGMASRQLAAVAAERPTFFAALSVAAEGRVLPAAGGVLVRGADGGLLGAVGVSGDTSDRDEECAVAGVQAAGLAADVGP